uniref:G_PROTEIN_RECEP_F1_2 domain-containing protein n=1 Tax=Rhabditophanes sp. KR3021 TaxID=114890 RepID=A0AC35TSN8_9BILA
MAYTICFDYSTIPNNFEPLISKNDVSPPVNNNWTNICSPGEDQTILQYDEAKNYLADSVIPTSTMILSLIGFIVNLFFIYIVYIGIKKKILPFKGYSLMFNRSITDAVVAFVTFVFVVLHKFDVVLENSPSPQGDNSTNQTQHCYVLEYMIPHGKTVFTLLLTIDFWSVSGAYSALAIITYIAVRHPVYTRSNMTDRKIIFGMIIIWVIGVIYSIIVVLISSNNAFNVFSSSADLIQWTVSTNDYVLSISNIGIVFLAFCAVVVSYLSIVIYLWRHKQASGSAHLHFLKLGRMGLNISMFAVTCMVMAAFVALPIFLKSKIDDLKHLSMKSTCQSALSTYELSYSMTVWTTIAMIGWMARIIIDPMLNIVLDTRFMQVVKTTVLFETVRSTSASLLKSSKTSTPNLDSSKDFLTKCARLNVYPSSVTVPEGNHYFRYNTTPQAVIDKIEAKKKRFAHVHMDQRVL